MLQIARLKYTHRQTIQCLQFKLNFTSVIVRCGKYFSRMVSTFLVPYLTQSSNVPSFISLQHQSRQDNAFFNSLK